MVALSSRMQYSQNLSATKNLQSLMYLIISKFTVHWMCVNAYICGVLDYMLIRSV